MKVNSVHKFHLNISPGELIKKLRTKCTIVDDNAKQNMIEEVVANLSSLGITAGAVAVLTLAAKSGGFAIFAHPVVGTIVVVISIIGSSCLKSYVGNMYSSYKQKKNKVYAIDSENFEENLLNILKKMSIQSNKIIPKITKNNNFTLHSIAKIKKRFYSKNKEKIGSIQIY